MNTNGHIWRAAVAIGLAGLIAMASAGVAEPLPRILILGDSNYQQPAVGAANILKGRVEVVFPAIPPGEVRSSGVALEHLDEWLGEDKWDVVHFNFGLGDLVHRAPGMKAFRVLPIEAGGVRATDPEQYEKNLRQLVMRLKATGAKLIWASTTPIRHSSTNVFEMGSEVEYNAIAAKVMAEESVPINDMYGYVTSLIDMKKPASHGVDPFFFDRKPVYPPIVRSILQELNLMRPVKGPVKVILMAGGWSHVGGGMVVDPISPRLGSPKGSLDELVLNEKTAAAYRHLLDKDGRWDTRPDVWIQFDRRGPKSGTLGIGYGGDRKRAIGSELALGHALGDHFQEQVCILKTALGTPSLAKELRPPGTGQTGASYTLLLKQIRDSLATLQDKFPDYTEGAGYEIVGLVLNLGEQDADAAIYADYLPVLITDLRKDLEVESLPVIIVGTGKGGRAESVHPEIIKAQQEVAGHSRFKDTVRYVETRDFWPPADARNTSRYPSYDRWYDNAGSYMLMGEALGRRMIELLESKN